MRQKSPRPKAGGDLNTGILAWYRDEKTSTQKKLAKGDQTTPKRLPHLYADKSGAQRAVDREWGRLQKSNAN